MKRRTDAGRLKALMTRNGWSNKELARRASNGSHTVSVRTVARALLDEKDGGMWPRTIEAIAKAFGVEVGVLTGELPDPQPRADPEVIREADRLLRISQWKVRVSHRVRNAYQLVAAHYQVPPSYIVELAPLMFMLLAEQSLASRRKNLDALTKRYREGCELAAALRHLPVRAVYDGTAEGIHDTEGESIRDRDLFARKFDNSDDHFNDDYDDAQDNPFAHFIRTLAFGLGVSTSENEERSESIADVRPAEVTYSICRETALRLAGNDERLAEDILDGRVALHEVPAELRPAGRETERIIWLKQKSREYWDEWDRKYGDALNLIGDIRIEGVAKPQEASS